jgi:hypothetical protein
MGKIAMVVFAVAFFLGLGVGGATAAEKEKPSKNVTSRSPAAEKAKPSKDVTNRSQGAANAQPSQNVTNTSRGAGKSKIPKDVTSMPTGKALNDLATGNQPAGYIYNGERGNPPPVQVDKSTSTRTPQQAIDEYLKSGEPTGRKLRPAAAPPSP